jgi:hypothetical protein
MSDVTEITQQGMDNNSGAATITAPQMSTTQLAVQASDARKVGLQLQTDLLAKVVNQQWDSPDNQPLAMAFLLTHMPLAKGATMSLPEALAFYLTAIAEGANPFTGELYRTGAWRFATNVQAKINKLRKMGIDVGVPKFTKKEREWPKIDGKPKKLIRYVNNQAVSFDMEKEPGVVCEITIGKSPVEQEVWLIGEYMPNNQNWYDRMDHMLQVRALGRCVTFGGGEGVSDQVGVDAPEDVKQVEEVETPKIKVSK